LFLLDWQLLATTDVRCQINCFYCGPHQYILHESLIVMRIPEKYKTNAGSKRMQHKILRIQALSKNGATLKLSRYIKITENKYL